MEVKFQHIRHNKRRLPHRAKATGGYVFVHVVLVVSRLPRLLLLPCSPVVVVVVVGVAPTRTQAVGVFVVSLPWFSIYI